MSQEFEGVKPNPLYRTIWRWHFYAGLFVMPFIFILSTTGAVYLFKPQLDRWEEREWRNLAPQENVRPETQIKSALFAYSGANVRHYRLPETDRDAPIVQLGLRDGTTRDVAVAPNGKVIGAIDPERRFSAWLSSIHGSLLIGRAGKLFVELAASWAMVMILTGLYLWWPRGRGVAGVLWPRLSRGSRTALRDLHAVTGFWVSGLAFVLLLTALPWTDIWARGFQLIRAEMGWVQGPQEWDGGAKLHAMHEHKALSNVRAAKPDAKADYSLLGKIVLHAKTEQLPPPVIIQPPRAVNSFGPPNGNVWTLTTATPNRPQVRKVLYDPRSGLEVSRSGFRDKHVIDRMIGVGISWHEGQLFGWVNQLIGVLTAAGLFTLGVSGFLMWRRGKPDDALGAPPPRDPAQLKAVAAIVFGLAAFLPLLAASLVVVGFAEKLVLPRMPRIAAWLGLENLPRNLVLQRRGM